MSALTYLVNTSIAQRNDRLNAKVLTRPALLVTDGYSTTYCVDCDIGLYASGVTTDASGKVLKDVNGNDLTGAQILRNVPIAPGNKDLIYAEAGAACELRRTASGQYEVVGFSKEAPGTYIRVPVNLGDFTLGAVANETLSSRPLTLGELSTFGGFGTVPFGAVAIFSGTNLIRIV